MQRCMPCDAFSVATTLYIYSAVTLRNSNPLWFNGTPRVSRAFSGHDDTNVEIGVIAAADSVVVVADVVDAHVVVVVL